MTLINPSPTPNPHTTLTPTLPLAQYVGVRGDLEMLAWWHCGEHNGSHAEADECFTGFYGRLELVGRGGGGGGGGGSVRGGDAVVDWKLHQWGVCLFTADEWVRDALDMVRDVEGLRIAPMTVTQERGYCRQWGGFSMPPGGGERVRCDVVTAFELLVVMTCVAACARHVHGMCKACAQHVQGMCTACAQRHAHGMCKACAKHVRGMRVHVQVRRRLSQALRASVAHVQG